MEKRLVALYSRLLASLPPSFRDSFAEEMAQVFARRIQEGGCHRRRVMLRIFAGEVLALPGLWMLAHKRERRALTMNDSRASTIADGPASWRAALAAALPLAAFSVFDVLSGPMRRLLHGVDLDVVYNVLWADAVRASVLPMIFYLLVLGGLLIGWWRGFPRGFPRWSAPYLGWLVVVLIFGLGVSGLDDPHLWRSWGAFLATLLLASLKAAPLKTLAALRHGWRRDWTRASFAVFSFLQFLTWGCFDEMPGPRMLWRVVSTAVLVTGAVCVMRASSRAGRIAALLGGAALNYIVSFGVMGYYWHGVQKPHSEAPANGYEMVANGLPGLAFTVVPLLVPALLSAALNRFFPNRSTLR